MDPVVQARELKPEQQTTDGAMKREVRVVAVMTCTRSDFVGKAGRLKPAAGMLPRAVRGYC